MIVAGIDTGKRGAIVVIDTESTWAWAEKLKYNKKKLLLNRIGDRFNNVDLVIIEKIKGRGGWTAATSFGMGFYFGQIMHEVVKTGRQFEYVLPEAWTGIMHRNVTGKDAKKKTLAAYHAMFPHDPVGITRGSGAREDGYHDGLIDALMIAAHFVVERNGIIRPWTFEEGRSLKCS